MNRRAFLHIAASTVVATSLKASQRQSLLPEPSIHPTTAFVASLPHLLDLATLPGLGMAVVRPGEPIWQHYLGVANVTTKTPIAADSLFPARRSANQSSPASCSSWPRMARSTSIVRSTNTCRRMR